MYVDLVIHHENRANKFCGLPAKFAVAPVKSGSFAIVEIVLPSSSECLEVALNRRLYISWNGTVSKSNDALEIPHGWVHEQTPADQAQIAHGNIISVLIHWNILTARNVFVRPMTPFDWDVISSHASYVEQHLLRSVPFIHSHQVLKCSISASLKARLLITEIEFDGGGSGSKYALDADFAKISNATSLIVEPVERPKPSLGFTTANPGDATASYDKIEDTINMSLQSLDVARFSCVYPLVILPSHTVPCTCGRMQGQLRTATFINRDCSEVKGVTVSDIASRQCARIEPEEQAAYHQSTEAQQTESFSFEDLDDAYLTQFLEEAGDGAVHFKENVNGAESASSHNIPVACSTLCCLGCRVNSSADCTVATCFVHPLYFINAVEMARADQRSDNNSFAALTSSEWEQIHAQLMAGGSGYYAHISPRNVFSRPESAKESATGTNNKSLSHNSVCQVLAVEMSEQVRPGGCVIAAGTAQSVLQLADYQQITLRLLPQGPVSAGSASGAILSHNSSPSGIPASASASRCSGTQQLLYLRCIQQSPPQPAAPEPAPFPLSSVMGGGLDVGTKGNVEGTTSDSLAIKLGLLRLIENHRRTRRSTLTLYSGQPLSLLLFSSPTSKNYLDKSNAPASSVGYHRADFIVTVHSEAPLQQLKR
jgi:hypothetical protein